MNTLQILFVLVVSSLLISGCSSQRETWKITQEVSPPAIEATLNSDATFPYVWDQVRSTVPGVDPPVHLRPCCVFAMDFRVQLVDIPIPGVKIPNIIDTADLGLHTYDAGFVGHGTDQDEVESNETNGILYTCRGGFIDVAHARDYSDWTLYLAFWIYRTLGEKLELVLPPELGVRKIIVNAFDRSPLDREQEVILAATMAQWAAYKLSAWHEIAQWHGFGLKAFPEYPSAFSVEDMYSNILGVKIAAAIIYSGGSITDQLYSRNFDQWLKNTLDYLGAQTIENSRALMGALDRHWWDSSKMVPDKYIVLKRNYDLGPVPPPAIPPKELLANTAASQNITCDNDTAPVMIKVVEEIFNYKMTDLVSLEIAIDDEFAPTFSWPTVEHKKKRVIRDSDFLTIAEACKNSDEKELERIAVTGSKN